MQRTFLVILIASSGVLAVAQEAERLSPDLALPVKIEAGGKALDVGRDGHAAPLFADFDGDRVRDMLVGQFDQGRIRVYRNEGTNAQPRFGRWDWLLADGKPLSVPIYCCVSPMPQLVDLDCDGRLDLLTGSAPGEMYLFRRRPDGTLAAGEKLHDTDGKEITPGPITTAFAVDWDGDGRLDLIMGNNKGEVHLSRNQSVDARLVFGTPELVNLNDPRDEKGDSAPIASDWDGDGLFDLIVGMENGSVYWFRNEGGMDFPKFGRGQCLIPRSPLTSREDSTRGQHDWGLRVKPCVADFDGNGQLDLLLGDYAGDFTGKPEQTPAEVRDEQTSLESLPKLCAAGRQTYAEYRNSALNSSSGKETLIEQIKSLKSQIETCETTIKRYEPQRQSHGHVWLFFAKSLRAARLKRHESPKPVTR